MPNTPSTSVDVLVVGAGPTGLMVANQMARRGIRVAIIDRHTGPAQQTRAMAVHARTLEIYAHLGIASEAIQAGIPATGMNVWSAGRLKARIPFSGAGQGMTAFPYVLMLGQDENERIMGAHLNTLDVQVQWETELVALAQHPDRVEATLKQPGGSTATVTAAYVAGCDGGHSSVRELSGIRFPGAPYEHVFFVADTVATGSMIPGQLNVYLWRGGFHLYFPIRGDNRWRVIGILPERLQNVPDLQFEALIPTLVQAGSAGLSFISCSWFSTYRIHHRCTERFRDRRCFLIGDAAHVHSPVGGQGMNTGLQDAYNLAWKLALVLEGCADSSLLDSYEAERAPVAHRLLATTDRAFQIIVSDHWLAAMFRTRIAGIVAALALTRKRVQNVLFRIVSQIGISYRTSPLAQTLTGIPDRAPRAGDRFPYVQLRWGADSRPRDLLAAVDDTRFSLIVIGQPASSAHQLHYGNLLDVYEISPYPDNVAELTRASIPTPSYYLLRPDGHVGLAGTRLDVADVRRWFARARINPEMSSSTDSSRAMREPITAQVRTRVSDS